MTTDFRKFCTLYAADKEAKMSCSQLLLIEFATYICCVCIFVYCQDQFARLTCEYVLAYL